MKKTHRFFTSIFLAAVIVLVILEIFAVFNSRLKYPKSDLTVVLRLDEVDLSKATDTVLNWQTQYSSRIDTPLTTVSLDHIYLPPGYLSGDDVLCIDRLEVSNVTVTNLIVNSQSNSLIGNVQSGEVCLRSGKNYIVIPPENAKVIFYDSFTPEYFYPFDQRTVHMNLTMDVAVKNGDQLTLTTVSPAVDLIVPRRWNRKLDPVMDENTLNLKVSLVRPIIYKTLAVFLPLVIILIMLYLPRIKNDGSFWEVVAGLTLGLWGIYEVLVPENYILPPTILSNAILGLYFLLGIVILFELFVEPPTSFLHRLVFRGSGTDQSVTPSESKSKKLARQGRK